MDLFWRTKLRPGEDIINNTDAQIAKELGMNTHTVGEIIAYYVQIHFDKINNKMIHKNDLKAEFYIFGNKGACWSNRIHIARSGETLTLCGTAMVSTNWARLWEHEEARCPDCLEQYNNRINN